jgi:type IV pilus assembly protein PilQ
LAVDLGIDKIGASSIAVGIMNSDNVVLDLELSALQSDGHGEVVATPKVLTADKQKALIASGKQIPYNEASSSGASAIKFINAELRLEVTPILRLMVGSIWSYLLIKTVRASLWRMVH